MSRSRQRRVRRFSVAVENLIRARNDLVAFAAEARRIAATDVCLWRAAEAAAEKTGRPLTDDERAVLARAINPRLAPRTPDSVHRQHTFLRKSRSPAVSISASQA